jgi:hypothetical protein
MSDETKVSWSGTLTLIILWGIGPFIYLSIYIVNLIKRKYFGGIENLEAVEEAVVPSKKGEEDSTTIAETDYDGKPVQNWTSIQYLFSLIGYAIGIGNVWRFCYVIAQDGGSASLFGTFYYVYYITDASLSLCVSCMRCGVCVPFFSSQNSLSVSHCVYILSPTTTTAYIICTIFVATPLFMYEMIIGQYLRLHAANAWQYIKPRYQGLAISQFVMLLIGTYTLLLIV